MFDCQLNLYLPSCFDFDNLPMSHSLLNESNFATVCKHLVNWRLIPTVCWSLLNYTVHLCLTLDPTSVPDYTAHVNIDLVDLVTWP